jgi:hypothetical protein
LFAEGGCDPVIGAQHCTGGTVKMKEEPSKRARATASVAGVAAGYRLVNQQYRIQRESTMIVDSGSVSRLRLHLAATATATTFAVFGLGVAAPAVAASNACPGVNALSNFVTDANVGANVASSGGTSTYTFVSIVDEDPVNAVPGLVAYCVYTLTAPQSVSVTEPLLGDNGQQWTTSGKTTKNFAFLRPSGAKSNIPLEGQTLTMGTATWTYGAPAPEDQIVLLHVDDPQTCSIYGAGLTTCFVYPTPVSLAPVCDKGAADLSHAAYSSIPRDAVDCGPPSYGFEANGTTEFGDQVQTATGGELLSLTVLFNSYGCSVSGHWNTGDCDTNPGDTFTHPITATIYISGGATVTSVPQTFTIPYRPSADPSCTGAYDGAWYNSISKQCEFSAKKLLTFTFPAGTTLPSGSEVIWSVAFNTTHYGYPLPIGPSSCSGLPQGCGYDSLNVGTKTYATNAFAGTDLSEPDAFRVQSGSIPPPVSYSLGAGYRPLGQINLAP